MTASKLIRVLARSIELYGDKPVLISQGNDEAFKEITYFCVSGDLYLHPRFKGARKDLGQLLFDMSLT